MKSRLCRALFVLFLFSGVCLAQAPAGALIVPGPNEVSVDFLVPQKGPGLSHYGVGGQISGSHFFDEHVGITAQGDYMRTDFYNVHDAGVRVGPTMRIADIHGVQPYVEFLVGYARVEAGYLKPETSFHGSVSVMGGVGVDFPLAGRWYAKVGVDLEDNWSASTRVSRGLLGISYRFGGR